MTSEELRSTPKRPSSPLTVYSVYQFWREERYLRDVLRYESTSAQKHATITTESGLGRIVALDLVFQPFLNSNALNTYFSFVEGISSSFLFSCSTFPSSPLHQNDEASDAELVEALICSNFVNNMICHVPLFAGASCCKIMRKEYSIA